MQVSLGYQITEILLRETFLDKKRTCWQSRLTEIKIENYLLKESNFKTRQLISKLRVSDHNLEVEMGRYKNVPRDQRLCKLCNKIDDE